MQNKYKYNISVLTPVGINIHGGKKLGRALIEAGASDENSVNRLIDLMPAYRPLSSHIRTDFTERWNETYTWNKVTTCITGLFSPADRALEHYGDMIIKCNTGEVCTVKFHKPEAKRPDSFRAISGVVLSTGHEVGSNWTLFGKWDEYLICRNSNNENNCIWKPTPLPSNAAEYYGLTAFAITLNEPVPRAEVDLGRVPITDCRLRPDQRLLEEGRIEEAEIEKSRLEDDQRRRMKLQTFGVNNSSNPKEAIWNSRWFIQTSNPAQQDETRPSFKFNEKYWSIREQCGFKQLDLPTLW